MRTGAIAPDACDPVSLAQLKQRAKSKPKSRSTDVWLLLIGVFKLTKAISLIIVGFGLLRLMHQDVAQ